MPESSSASTPSAGCTPVTVNEPSIEDSIKILKGLAPNYEAYHGVKISDGILRQAVLLSERYITDRFLPDKAIDLIDEACSRLNLDSPQLSEIPELQNELERLQAQLDELTQSSARAEEQYVLAYPDLAAAKPGSAWTTTPVIL